jgi:putative acetyltransferase
LIVRPAEPDDVPVLSGIAQSSYSSAFVHILEEEVLEDYDITFFMGRFAHSWERMLVACLEDEPVGFLLMTNGHIDMLFMDPATSGKGGGPSSRSGRGARRGKP